MGITYDMGNVSVNRDQPSKSKRVQEFLRANPQARNRDVVSALEEHGVTAADVSNAKAQLKKKYTRRRSRAAAVVAATVSTGETVSDEPSASISMAEIEAAIDYVQAVGGISRAQQLLAIIQQIQEMN
jgi:hypothetical protein